MRTHQSLMTMSRRDKEALHDTMRDAHSYLRSNRDAGSSGARKKSTLETVLEPIEIGGAAALIGVIAGRTGSTSIGSTGIPLGLVAGAIGHGLVAFDLLPEKANHHVQSVANGAIAGWTALWGAGQGLQMREKALGTAGPIVSGRGPDAIGHAPAPPSPPSPPPQYAYQQPPRMLGAQGPAPFYAQPFYPASAPASQIYPGSAPASQIYPNGPKRPLTEAELQLIDRQMSQRAA